MENRYFLSSSHLLAVKFIGHHRIERWVFLLLFSFWCCRNAKYDDMSGGKIIVLGLVSPDFNMHRDNYEATKESFILRYTPLFYTESNAPITSVNGKVIHSNVKWIIYSDKPLRISPPFATSIIVNPGDSICIKYTNEFISYSGKDSSKFALHNELMFSNSKISPPSGSDFMVKNLNEFLLWNSYLNSKLDLQMSIIESYKDRLSNFDYEYYKMDLVSKVNLNRVQSFSALQSCMQQGTIPGMTSSDLIAIWDSTLYKPWSIWLRSVPKYYGSMYSFYAVNRMEIQRRFGFDFSKDSLKSKEIRTYLYYRSAKENYKGLLRERLIAYILDEQTINELGIKNPMTQNILGDYYKQPGFPEYKHHVKELEEKAVKLTKN